jgi:hypothetical protein
MSHVQETQLEQLTKAEQGVEFARSDIQAVLNHSPPTLAILLIDLLGDIAKVENRIAQIKLAMKHELNGDES